MDIRIKYTLQQVVLLVGIFLFNICSVHSQVEVPIVAYSVNENGQVSLQVNSSPENYYILKVRHRLQDQFALATSMTLGAPESTTITEPLSSYPQDHYQVLEYPIQAPGDMDGDGVDDITEFNNLPIQSPLNFATPISIEDGVAAIDSFATFNELSITRDEVQWSEFLNGKGFVKFIFVAFNSENPVLYFIESNTYALHADFAAEVGIPNLGSEVKKGQIIYHPTIISQNGTLGTFTFNYSNGHGEDFEVVQKCHELLAANMPFLKNNLSYYITDNNEDEYQNEIDLYNDSRVSVLFEADAFAELDYWGLNQAEGYGYFRQMSLEDIPGPRDIVLYESLPNALPRVGGIMTSVIQTPLSHVNLRAIQDQVPNAFIRDPLSIDSIADLLNHYIYYKVGQESYSIREASIAEVNDWYEDLRPEKELIPPLNLDYQTILPLDQIRFIMYDGFGAKTANVAAMRSFGFPEGTIPDGYGIPFYFYQEFMEYNDFFSEVATMISDPDFIADREVRNIQLAELREKITNAEMPNWMLEQLVDMQQSFPTGTSIRCRSSTNNEDLPGFNGAGLYTSKTQHSLEGHISKSIKQVYASLWNLRAYDEREFFRVSHFTASMGLLCHPNYSEEWANGVGVTTDPIYQTDDTFYYLNSQIGEDLITNPDTLSIPEEILLSKVVTGENDHIVVRHSNLVPNNGDIMEGEYLNEMRDFLTVIHKNFERLYNAENNPTFAMDIEYKITSSGQLIIKQARPWATYVQDESEIIVDTDNLEMVIYPNPATDYIFAVCEACAITKIRISTVLGEKVFERNTTISSKTMTQIYIGFLAPGLYLLTGFDENETQITAKFMKR